MLVPKVPHLIYGADYNPEQWPEDIWEEDVRLMREAGVNFVSLGIFSWAMLEPRPGEYDFAWLDQVLDRLHQGGIAVNLATATASPPPWLAALHPESLPVTASGTTLWPGSRQQYCPSSDAYRHAAATLVRRVAERYRDHPALAMWHVNNEYGCHVSACYCDRSAAHFRVWLQHRYGTLDALNRAWGTSFWSQRYGDWDEINPPRAAPTLINPTQQLDFHRFSSDALLECFELERAILKEVTPRIPITTNFMGFFKPLDYWRWAAREDVVSDDSYPDPADAAAPMQAAMSYDLMRSLGGGRPWMLMEQTTSQVNWRSHNVLKRPGQMRLWSYQALARGADGVMFFQWRAGRAGAEKFHGALVPHAGAERSRIWREVTGLGAELSRLDALLDSHVQAEVAILFDWESWWALELPSKPSSDVRLLEQVRRFYQPLYQRNIPVDFARPDANLSAYNVVLVPNLYLIRDGVAENLERFVADGGSLLMSFFSGIVDGNDHILLGGSPRSVGGYPAPFRRLLGIRVEELDPYVPGQTNQIVTAEGERFTCDLWSDVIDLEGAEPLATFVHDFYAGRPAVTRHPFGRGAAYYLGINPEASYLAALLDRVCREAAVAPPLETPPGVEAAARAAGADRFLFLLNHNPHKSTVDLRGQHHDLLTNTGHRGAVTLAPYGVAILRLA